MQTLTPLPPSPYFIAPRVRPTVKISPSCPSAAKIAAALNISVDAATKIRAHAKAGFERTPGLHKSHDVSEFLEPLNALAETCGVESLYPERPSIWYLNTGDTYALTLCYNDKSDTFSLRSWGSFVGA